MVVHGFDWDEGNLDKCRGHGLSIEDIESVFTGEPAVMVNTRHTSEEDRLQAIGFTAEGRYAFIVFTFREVEDGKLIRPISARFMHQKEIEHYEKQTKA